MKFKPFLVYALLALSIFLFGKLTEENILFPRFNKSYVQRFQKIYSTKEKELNKTMMELRVLLSKSPYLRSNDFILSKYMDLLDQKGLAIFIYRNDSLKLWSDNSVPISSLYSTSHIDSTLIYLKNGWYVPRTIRSGRFTLVGLILIKQSYQYENKYLTSSFQRDFNASPTVKIATRNSPGSFPIVDCRNNFLFSLYFDQDTHHSLFQTYIPSACYLLLVIFMLWILYQVIKHIPNVRKRNRVIFITFTGIVMVKILMLHYQIPAVFYELDLFKPQYFAASEFIPSLGDLLLWTIVVSAAFFVYYKSFTYALPAIIVLWRLRLKLFFRLTISLISFYGIFFLIRSIILNSTISFEANKLLLFDSYSFFGYIVIMLLFTSFTLYFDKILRLYAVRVSFWELSLNFCFNCLLWAGVLLVLGSAIHYAVVIFILIFGNLLIYIRFKAKSSYSYSTMVLIAFCYALFTVFIVTKYSFIRNYNQKKVMITNLANEHDPVAEYILHNINRELSQDTFLLRMVFGKEIDLDKIKDYLKRRYLEGYFEKYDLEQITICSPKDSVNVVNPGSPDNAWSHCYTFFRNMIAESGSRVPESNFYYIDFMNGRIRYLGWFEYHLPLASTPVSIFIELSSKLVNEELGYPELLLDNRFASLSKLKEYSYAKYYKGQLISQYGRYSYNLSSRNYEKSKKEYAVLLSGGQDHLIYRPNNDSLIVLSSPNVTLLDLAIFFSYTFLVYFLIVTFVVLMINLPMVKSVFEPNFKNKIQFSIMSLLFISLILIGSGTLFFNKRQYFKKHNENISEKLQSIYVELSPWLSQEQKIGPRWRIYPYNNINELLIRISNVFYIDINLYDPEGNLIATSRPEIFDKGLIGKKMNARAYADLVSESKANVIHNEKIGSLSYISGYVPFKNNDNKLIAFINLPYFTRQEELTREVSTMVVAVVNIYVVLLLITSLFAVFISRKITLPLRFIQTKFSEIKLGQQYEKIAYTSNDEIGGLVNEYNRMVMELEKSIEMLSKSERESAWREMAKQIAHEINNPLTPMKLSVQHLQRAWADKNERFEEYLRRISRTLIEEIDNLSSIATEFSNFAKMPNAVSERLDLVSKIENVVSLFSNENVKFQVNLNGVNEVPVFADKEQISRVFINLFKNAIQSVEKGIDPLIVINLYIWGQWVEVRVKDNGKGIPVEMREKLFRPNFTTKTSGMGLGLAITKNIIESAGGTIGYESEENKGTTFIIRLPVYNRKEYL
jgi:two-component system, NtrC family, nitrogen regulation sensor histidine kinase NtrY